MFQKWLQDAKYTVAFTGAGISTESGLPDFRPVNQVVWQKSNPVKLASINALNNHEEEFIQFFEERVLSVKEHAPNAGHRTLANWEKKGLIKSIITQNVDGFHQLAGSKRVLELHGTLQKLHCKVCGEGYDSNEYVNGEFYCSCGGILRPSIVLFGEALPQLTLKLALQEIKKADLVLVLGSSLTVSPANQFPILAKKNGARLVIVNHDETPLDTYADLIIQDKKIGELLKDMAKLNDQ